MAKSIADMNESPGWFFERMREFANRTAFVADNLECTYAELLDRASGWQDTLANMAVRKGDCVGNQRRLLS
jgi:hypothetical protein